MRKILPFILWTQLLALIVGCSSVPSAPLDENSERTIVFVDVNVIPMDRERVLSNQTVVIQGEHIVAMGNHDSIDLVPDAYRIDGRGKYLIPGLADMHVHLYEEEGEAYVGEVSPENALGQYSLRHTRIHSQHEQDLIYVDQRKPSALTHRVTGRVRGDEFQQRGL